MQVSKGNHFRVNPSLFTRVSLTFKETNVLINSDPVVRYSRKLPRGCHRFAVWEVPTVSRSNPGSGEGGCGKVGKGNDIMIQTFHSQCVFSK